MEERLLSEPPSPVRHPDALAAVAVVLAVAQLAALALADLADTGDERLPSHAVTPARMICSRRFFWRAMLPERFASV